MAICCHKYAPQLFEREVSMMSSRQTQQQHHSVSLLISDAAPMTYRHEKRKTAENLNCGKFDQS